MGNLGEKFVIILDINKVFSAGDLEQSEDIRRTLLERPVPRHCGDAEDLQLGRVQRQHQRVRVVLRNGAEVGVEDDPVGLGRTRRLRPGRPDHERALRAHRSTGPSARSPTP